MSKFVIGLPANLVVRILNLMEKLMLNSAHIQNFRLFKDFQIDDLAQVNLIVGKNNVGKSSLLEAINLLNNPQPIRALYALLESRGEIVPNGKHDDQSGYEFVRLFNNRNKKTNILLEGNKTAMNIRWKPEVYGGPYANDNSPSGFGVDFSRSVQEDPYIFMPSSGVFVNTDQPAHVFITFESRPPSIFTTYSDLEYAQLVSAWDAIQLTPSESSVVKFLQIIEPAIERIANQQTNERFMVKSKKFADPVPIKSFGNGISAVLAISLGLAQAENGYLLIDEIDTGLHYRELTEVWRAIMETAVRLNIQVFATTHSYDCMRSFAEALSLVEDDSVGALFRLQRRGENIESLRFDAENIIYAIEQDIEMR